MHDFYPKTTRNYIPLSQITSTRRLAQAPQLSTIKEETPELTNFMHNHNALATSFL
jgi:hypothetical protein